MCKRYIDEYNEDYNKKHKNNIYIDPDGTEFVDKISFYIDLTEFLNIRENKFFSDSKDKYIYLPPKKSLKFYENSSKYKTIKKIFEDNKIDSNMLDDTKITVLKNGKKCFCLTSDQFGFSEPKTSTNPYYKLKDKCFVSKCLNDTRTIGGSFLFPTLDNSNRCPYNTADNKKLCPYNTARSAISYIEDRVDLTLLEIKHTYYYEEDREKYKKDILYKQYYNLNNLNTHMKEWLEHFKTFEKYANFFCFEGNFVNKGEIVDITKPDNLPEVVSYEKILRYINDELVLKRILDKVRKLALKRSEKMESIINKIKVINFDKFVDKKIKFKMHDVQFISIDTSLSSNEIKTNNNEYLKNIINEDDIVFIVCGSVKEDIMFKTAETVKSLSSLTIGIGLKNKLLSNLNKYVDTVISIPCDNSKDITNINLDKKLYYTIKSISDIIFTKGIIDFNLDDIKTFFKNGRNALVTIGSASGGTRAIDSTLQAYNKLTNKDFTDIIINIVSDNSLTNFEVEYVVGTIRKSVNNENINLQFQVIINNELNKNKEIIVTLIAFY